MTAKRFSRLFCQLMGFVMFASLSIWSSSTFAACNDVVPNGLIACYPFSGNANDASGNKNNGTLKGGVTLTADRFGNANSAYQLDGISGYIEVADNPTLDVGTGDYSMSIWVHYEGDGRVDAWSVKGVLIDKRGNPGGYMLYLYSSQVGTQIWSYDNSQSHNFNADAVIENNDKWHHVVATVERGNSSTKVKLYMDGALIQTIPFAAFPTLDNDENLYIGYRDGQVFLKASLDDVRLYKRALTDAEVKQLYNEANPEPVVCAPANYTNGVLKVPFITIDGVTDAYKATMLQYNSGFAFRVTESAVMTGKSNCPATYSPTTGILHIPLVKTKSAIPLNTFQCYDVTLQAFSDRFQLDLETLKVVKCP